MILKEKQCWLSAVTLSLILPTASLATPDFYVETSSAGLADGSSWANASTLQFALDNANDGEEIWMAEGIYTNGGPTAFTVADNVTIYGGFTNGMVTLGERDFDAHAAHLDGTGSNRVLMINDSCTLDGIILTNGYANVGSGSSHGSAIFKNGLFTLNIRNCKIVDCHMVDEFWAPKGAALYLALGTTIITNSTLARNGDGIVAYRGTGREGQAIYCTSEQLTLRNCTVSDNRPVDPFASRDSVGGAIRAAGGSGSLTIEDTTFEGNGTTLTPGSVTTPNGGGALTIGGPDANIRRCVFRGNVSGNYASVRPMVGGAIEVDSSSSSVLIDHCLFEDNVAGLRAYAGAGELADGGALFVEAGDVTVSSCSFVGNHAGADGGAIAVHGGSLEVVNSIFYTNSALTRASDITLIGGTLSVSYTRLGGTASPAYIYDESGGVTLMNTFTNDALFADADNGDYHLSSPAGRYNPGTMTFVTTDTSPYSPCIDAGDPSSPVGAEPVENGSRINLGYHGGTAQASKSPNLAPEIENLDNTVNINVVDVRGQMVNSDTIADCALYFSTSNPPTLADASASLYPGQQIGTEFQVTLIGLDYATTYYYRWFATNAFGSDWANTVSNFTTGAEPPGGGSHIIHVDLDAIGGEDGMNWFNAFTSLADAMAVVNANTNEIWIADGTYADAEITVSTACSIYGGFVGTETNRSQRDTGANHAHLNGGGVRRVITVNADCTLDGLILTNGIPPIGSTGGGAIFKSGAHTLTVNDCTITDNRMLSQSTTMQGAALYLAAGTTIITNSMIRNNGDLCSGYCGGGREGQGIYCNNENLTIRDCIIRDNFPFNAFASRGNEGGALHAEGSSGSLTIEDSSFINNRTPVISSTTRDGGGAISIQGPDAVIRRCLFEENKAGFDNNNYDMSGGAIEVESGSSQVTIEYCLFEYNIAGIRTGGTTIQESYGGALFVEAGNVTVSNCNFVGNHSRYDGGAVAIIGGTLDIVNCIMYTNTAGARGNNITALGGTLNVMYSVLDGTSEPDNVFDQNNDVTLMNVATADPLFNNSNGRDYHLRSPSGRYNPGSMTYVTTDTFPHSPAIDAGEKTTGIGDEPVENGNRVNVGYYGGTDQASKSPNLAPEVENRDSTVDVNVVTVRGEMVINDTIADCRLFYSTVNNPPITGVDPVVTIYPPQQIGTVFETTLSGLDFSTTYHYQWCASNFYGENCANTASNFATGPAPPSGGPHIIHVKQDAAGSGDGSSWFSAFTSLADAMAAVDNPNTNEIWVASGNPYDDATVTITEDVKIFGGFAGTETNRSERSVAGNGRPHIDGGDVRRVIEISGGTVLLDGVVITNGEAAAGNAVGLGIYVSSSTVDLSINDCIFEDNQYFNVPVGGGSGFGLYNDGADVAITNTLFKDNGYTRVQYQGNHLGMGIRQSGSGASLHLYDCIFENNSGHVTETRNSEGGALWANGGTILAEHCEFTDNKIGYSNGSTDGGGAAKFSGGVHKFANCLFRGNETLKAATTGYGGCMILDGGSTEVYLENCTIADSFALDQGAAFYVLSGSLFMTNCILWTNQTDAISSDAPNEGRDIANIGGYVEVSYSSFSGDHTDNSYVFDQTGVGLVKGTGLLVVDPLFENEFGDLHLQSKGGRFDPATGNFTNDTETSLCIDAGAPGGLSTYTNEVQPNGDRVNMGAYGNTVQASKTPAAVLPIVTNVVAVVTNNYATLVGQLIVNDATAEIFIYYGIGDSGESFTGWTGFIQPSPAQQSKDAFFSASIGDLLYNTTYTFRCFATNAAGFHWAQNPLTFTTGGEPAGGPDGVIHVKAGAPGAQSGVTWFDAAHTLAAGLSLVDGPTNEIWLATPSELLSSSITIATNVSIYGGFLGDPDSGETNRTQRSVDNQTSLDGNFAVRIFDITGSAVVLDGLTITNGYQVGSVGHGLRAIGVNDLALMNCVIEDNGRHDNTDGSGAYFSGGTITMSNTVFRSNGQGHGTQGGAIYADGNVALTMVDCDFLSNHNQGAGVGRQSQGGALYLVGGASLVAWNCNFIDNKVGDQASIVQGGGCVYMGSAVAYFKNCVFRGNGNDPGTAGAGPVGGTFLLASSTPAPTVTVVNCTLAFNEGESTTLGGLVYIASGHFIAKNSIIWENRASTLIASEGDEFYITGNDTVVDISWTDITGTNGNFVVMENTNITFTLGEGILSTDPLFVSATDMHLKSRGGRYDDLLQGFVGTDEETSICIDFGDPIDDVGLEPDPNGGIINLGAYGGTRFASRTDAKRGSALLFK